MKVDITVPVKWTELTQANLEFLTKLILNEVSEVELMTRCFLKFADMKLLKKDPVNVDGDLCYIYKKKGYQNFMLDVDRATDCIERMRFLVKDVTLFRLPEKLKNYVPVDFRLYSVSLEEYLLLDQFYAAYSKAGDPEWLDKMMAIAYRKKGEAWNNEKLKLRAQRFRRMPVFRKYIIYLWFTGLKTWFMSKYWFVYNQPEGNSNIPPDEEVMGLLSVLNGGNITLNKQILATSVHEVMFEINLKIEKSTTHV
jgi:hypothetical protein